MKQIILFLLLSFNTCIAMAQQLSTANIEDSMSPEQFKAAGLDKLNSSELKKLNAWINGEKTIFVAKLTEAGAKAPKPSTEDINSRLVGEFKGWRGNTSFTLENGQVWDQADGSELFASKLLNPKVRLNFSGLSGWKLQVEGYNSWVKVKRVK
jgi:hypothetical protein